MNVIRVLNLYSCVVKNDWSNGPEGRGDDDPTTRRPHSTLTCIIVLYRFFLIIINWTFYNIHFILQFYSSILMTETNEKNLYKFIPLIFLKSILTWKNWVSPSWSHFQGLRSARNFWCYSIAFTSVKHFI